MKKIPIIFNWGTAKDYSIGIFNNKRKKNSAVKVSEDVIKKHFLLNINKEAGIIKSLQNFGKKLQMY